MKKLLLVLAVLIVIAFFVIINHQNNDPFDTGVLDYQGTTEEAFQEGFDKLRDYLLKSDKKAEFSKDAFLASIMEQRRHFHFYTSLVSLIMELRSGRLEEIILPEAVANNLMAKNIFARNVQSTQLLESGLSFGFKDDDKELKELFDIVIKDMKADGTLDKLAEEYINGAESKDLKAVVPEKFVDAEELKIVVTGDMPPIDMFAENGEPTGYNTAVISEIGKRLKKNIKFVSTEAGGRSAALLSGRADVIFWYRSTYFKNESIPFNDIFKDSPEGVILSETYYSWDKEILIQMNKHEGILGWFLK